MKGLKSGGNCGYDLTAQIYKEHDWGCGGRVKNYTYTLTQKRTKPWQGVEGVEGSGKQRGESVWKINCMNPIFAGRSNGTW